MTKKIKVASSSVGNGSTVTAVALPQVDEFSTDQPFTFKSVSTKLRVDPVLKIGGTDIELIQLSNPELKSFIEEQYISQILDQPMPSGLKWSGRYPNQDILDFKNIKIWKATIGKVDFYLTRGSEVNVNKLTDATSDESGLIILIGSSIRAKTLTVLDRNTLLNSTIDVEKYFSTKESNYTQSYLHGDNFFSGGSNTIIGSYINVSGYLDVSKTHIVAAHINGVTGFNSDQTCVVNVEVSINEPTAVILSVVGQTFKNFIYSTTTQYGTNSYLSTKKKYDSSFILNVSKRIDYGYFNGLAESYPFIKLDGINLMIGGYVFTADEFKNPSFDHSKYSHSGYLPSPPFSPTSLPSNMEYMKGTDTWAKAEQMISGESFSGSKNPMGELATKSVSVLLEQIKSRISLLVEIKNILG